MQLHDDVEPAGRHRTTPRVLIASDKFKGSLTSVEVATALSLGLARAGITTVDRIPVADGGDGSLAAAVAAGGREVDVTARDVRGHARPTAVALLPDGLAVIEVARICGLGDTRPTGTDALTATSAGVGDAIRAALDLGADSLVLAVGGTASSDGGAGLVQALGGRLLDRHGRELGPGAQALLGLASVDLTDLDPRLSAARLVVASDVDNPLLGGQGAAAVYGPQKGAGPAEVARIDQALRRWSGLAAAPALAVEPGAGAGGGIGFGALLLGGLITSGAEYFLDLLRLDGLLRHADLVITGEGRLDAQSLRGKAPLVVADRARAAGVPVHAVVGRCDLPEDLSRTAGLASVHALADLDPRCADDPDLSRRLLAEIGARLGREAAGTTADGGPALL